MDNVTLNAMASNCCPALMTKFSGVWSADNFQINLAHASSSPTKGVINFQIVNSARAGEMGQHWLLLLLVKLNDHYYSVQPLGDGNKSGRNFFVN